MPRINPGIRFLLACTAAALMCFKGHFIIEWGTWNFGWFEGWSVFSRVLLLFLMSAVTFFSVFLGLDFAETTSPRTLRRTLAIVAVGGIVVLFSAHLMGNASKRSAAEATYERAYRDALNDTVSYRLSPAAREIYARKVAQTMMQLAQDDPASTVKHVAVPPAPIWTKRTEASAMDGSKGVYLSTISENTVFVSEFSGEMPEFQIRCHEGRTSIIIVFETFLGISDAAVTYRIDDLDPYRGKWSISTDNKAVGLWRGSDAIPVIRKMLDREQLLVRVTPYASSSIEMTFKIKGLREEIAELTEACHWKL